MRFPVSVAVFACIALAVACGGDDGETSPGEAPDTSEIATATLPVTLPEVTVIGGAAVQAGGISTYTVRAGDTLASIADRFRLTLEDLREANPNLDPAALQVGDVVRLPLNSEEEVPTAATATPAEAEPTDEPEDTPTTAPAATNTPSTLGQTYTVQAGDIPVTIAEKFGISVESLLAANPGINPSGLQIGQVLVIPPAPTATPEPDAATESEPTGG